MQEVEEKTKKKKKKKVLKIDTDVLERQYKEDNEENPLKRAYTSLKKSGAIGVVLDGFKIVLKGFVWMLKQVVSLMILGMKGTTEGFKESASKSKSKSKSRQQSSSRGGGGETIVRYVDNRQVTIVNPPETKKRPIWHIPTKEEEEAEKMGFL